MGFVKGICPNKNGRPKGSVNKNKAYIQVLMDLVIDNNIEKFKTELDKLEGEKFVKYFLHIAKILTNEKSGVYANKRLIDLYSEKIKTHGK